jgi:vacuolar-type H+-ATPase subunit H
MLIFSLILLLLIIFTVLILIFRKVMTQNVIVATRHIEELNEDYIKKDREATRQLEEAKLKAEEIVNSARQEAEKLKAEIIQNAGNDRDNLIKQARTQSEEIMQQADKSRQQLLAEIQERIAKDAATKACELIQNTLPEEFRKEAHAHWVEDLLEKGFSSLERLRIPEDMAEVRVVSAFNLTEEQRKNLSKKLKAALGREVTVKEEIDQKVVAGIVIHIGSLVLDGSLKNKIQEKAR